MGSWLLWTKTAREFKITTEGINGEDRRFAYLGEFYGLHRVGSCGIAFVRKASVQGFLHLEAPIDGPCFFVTGAARPCAVLKK